MKIQICGINVAEAWRDRNKNGAYRRCFQTLCLCIVVLLVVVVFSIYDLATGTIVVNNEFWQEVITVAYDVVVTVMMLYILRNFYRKKLFCNGTFRLIESIALCTISVHILIFHICGHSFINGSMLQCLSLVGLYLLTLAEILRLGVQLQEENDLTI